MWKYQGNAERELTVLSSDVFMGQTEGRSLHGDFWNTWEQPMYEQFLQREVHGKPSGDNEKGREVLQPSRPFAAPPRHSKVYQVSDPCASRSCTDLY